MAKRAGNRFASFGSAINRREFVGGAVALGVAGGIIGNPSRASAQTTPKRGGVAKIATSDQNTSSDTLEPRKVSFIIDHARVYSLFNTLIRFSTKLEPQPELAVSWDVSPDAKIWTFKIRQGIQFHNGKTLDAEDVVYSLNLHRPPNESVVKSYFQGVKDIKADGKDVVRIELNQPNADFPMYLGSSHTGIVQNGYKDTNDGIGTGPYKVTLFRPGSRFVAERNPTYWKSGLPYLDGVEIFGIPAAEARVNALLAGDVDFIVRVNPRDVPAIERSSNVKLARAKSGRHLTVVMMMDREPFKDNLDLRLAIKHAIDREGIVRDVRRGMAMKGNDHPVSPIDPYYCQDIPFRPFDPDKAKFHMQKSGFANTGLVLHTSEVLGSEAVDIAVHLQQSAAKCGINIEVKREPTDGYYANIWMGRPFHLSGFQPRPTADLMLSLVHQTGAKWNETRFNSERIDKLLLDGRATVDTAKRREIYCAIQRIIWEQGGTILPMFLDFLDAHSARLRGFEPHPAGEAGALRLAEGLWIDA